MLACELVLPGKHMCRCSVRASRVTDLWAEFIAEIANSSTSPKGMNCDWLMGDILMGDTSPVKREKIERQCFKASIGGTCGKT